jgi:hypothetical protein
MTRLRLALTGLVAVLFGVLSSIAPAAAITGGTVDEQEQYPNVGIIVFYEGGLRYRCSATLVSPTVLLTAAHCTAGTLGKTIVNFDWDIDDAAPSDIPRAADDPGDGTSSTGYTHEVADTWGRVWATGTAHAHPQYSDFTDLKNWNDVGVVVLDEPVTGIAPARLAPTDYLDRFAQPALNHTLFTLVGYGTEVRKADTGPQKPTPMSYPIVRRFTDEVGQKLTPQILQTNGNEHDNRGGGGTCFGDSGGPSFKDGYLTTVTSYGYTGNCRYLGGLQRVDIAVVQDWLADFGVTP